MNASRKSGSASRMLRLLSLTGVWAFMTYVTILHQKTGGGPEGAPTVHTLCPFGGMATLYKVVADGTFIQRTFPSAIILLLGTVVLALVFRRAFCGWICPLGAMQELFAALGRKLHWRRPTHDNKIDGSLRWVKYLLLFVILFFTYRTGELVFSPYDPWASYAHLTAGWGEIAEEFLIGTIVLFAAVLGSVFIDRPFCRYLCPLGAMLGVISKVGATRVVRNEETCRHCQRCDQACPVDIKVESMLQVRTTECLSCGECIAVCPVPQTLEFKARRRVVSPLVLGAATLVIFFGMVLATQAAGVWKARPDSLTEITGEGVTLDAANIRGFMSLNDIEATYGMPAEELIRQLGLPENTDQTRPVSDIMKALDRDVHEVRDAVAIFIEQ